MYSWKPNQILYAVDIVKMSDEFCLCWSCSIKNPSCACAVEPKGGVKIWLYFLSLPCAFIDKEEDGLKTSKILLEHWESRRSRIMYGPAMPFFWAVRALYALRHGALHCLMTSWPWNRGFHQQRPPLSTKRLDRQSFCYDCWVLLCNQF